MSIRTFLAILACLFSLSLSTYSFTESKILKSTYETVSTDCWVLEYHDNLWWWVLYDTDGVKIMEIPAEF